MDEGRSAFKILTGTHTGKRPLGRPRRKWEDTIRMDCKEIGIITRNWVDSIQGRNYWRALVRFSLRRRSGTARELQQYLRRVTRVTVSHQTVRNRLRGISLRHKSPVRVSHLTQQHRAARLLFDSSHVNWQLRQWRPRLFTD